MLTFYYVEQHQFHPVYIQAGNFSRKFSEKFTANLSWGYIFGFWKSTLKKVNTDLTGETWSSLTPNVFVIYSINK